MSAKHDQEMSVARTVPAELDLDDQSVWRQWMVELGQQLRKLRELAGLSQQELARLAGVSQGAVSRLETARGLATPLLIVVKINLALTAELRKLDETILTTDPARTLGVDHLLRTPANALGPDAAERISEPVLEALVRLYHETNARRREGLLSIMKTAAAALRDKNQPDG